MLARETCYKPDIAARHPTSALEAVSNKTTVGPLPSSGRESAPGTTIFSAVQGLLDDREKTSEDDMRSHSEPSRPANNHRVFVVEGDEVIRSALQFILDDHNETHAFASLQPALAEASSRRPDVVLVGIDLMQDSGERSLTKIKARAPGAKILIVANSVRDPLALRCLEWGAHGVLGKPITFDSVCDKVDVLLRQGQRSVAAVG